MVSHSTRHKPNLNDNMAIVGNDTPANGYSALQLEDIFQMIWMALNGFIDLCFVTRVPFGNFTTYMEDAIM